MTYRNTGGNYMGRTKGRMMFKANRKEVTVTFRCTKELDKKIEEKTKRMGENRSQFLSDCVEIGLKRRTRYDKGKGRSLVEMQEAMNQMIRTLTPEQEDEKAQILELEERMMKLWDF